MTIEDPTNRTPTPTPTPTPIPPPDTAQPATPPPPGTPPPPSPQPAWQPPPADQGRSASLILGLIILVIGGWFFATRTLGLDLPRVDWGQAWPILLIGLGLWVVWRSMQRSR